MTGWNEHGHARPTGLPVDEFLGSGELQDSEDCGYSPIYVLSRMGVDRAHGTLGGQYRKGRIYLTDGTVLARGGTLGCVWAVDHRMTCGCLVTRQNVHRGDCPEWVPQSRDGDWRTWTWVRREGH